MIFVLKKNAKGKHLNARIKTTSRENAMKKYRSHI